MMNYEDLKNEILIQAYNYPYFKDVGRLYINRPSWMNYIKDVSMYKIRKAFKQLKDDGLMVYMIAGGGCDEDYRPIPPWHGYMLTESGIEKAKNL